MRKVLIALSILALAGTQALARPLGHGHYGPGPGFGGSHQGHRGYNPWPWIAGAATLGILGAIYYDQYGRRCWREVVGVDDYGNRIVRRVCD